MLYECTLDNGSSDWFQNGMPVTEQRKSANVAPIMYSIRFANKILQYTELLSFLPSLSMIVMTVVIGEIVT